MPVIPAAPPSPPSSLSFFPVKSLTPKFLSNIAVTQSPITLSTANVKTSGTITFNYQCVGRN